MVVESHEVAELGQARGGWGMRRSYTFQGSKSPHSDHQPKGANSPVLIKMRFSLISCCNTAAYAGWAQCGSCQFDFLGVYPVCPSEAQTLTPSPPPQVALSCRRDA